MNSGCKNFEIHGSFQATEPLNLEKYDSLGAADAYNFEIHCSFGATNPFNLGATDAFNFDYTVT